MVSETAWRLLWALPLVLGLGIAGLVVLRSFLGRSAAPLSGTQSMSLRQTLRLSEQMQLHLIDVEGSAYLLVESAQQILLQPVLQPGGERSRSASRLTPAWIRHLYKANGR